MTQFLLLFLIHYQPPDFLIWNLVTIELIPRDAKVYTVDNYPDQIESMFYNRHLLPYALRPLSLPINNFARFIIEAASKSFVFFPRKSNTLPTIISRSSLIFASKSLPNKITRFVIFFSRIARINFPYLTPGQIFLTNLRQAQQQIIYYLSSDRSQDLMLFQTF